MSDILNELIEQALSLMHEAGVGESNLKTYRRCHFQSIRKYFAEAGESRYNKDLLENYKSYQRARLLQNKIRTNYYTCLMRATNILTDVYTTGTFKWRTYTSGPRYKVNPYFRSCLDSFLDTLSQGKTTKRHQDSRIRRFLNFLEGRGKTDFSAVGPRDLIDFLAYIYPHHKGDMGHTIHALRIFINFLVKNGMVTEKMLTVPLQKPSPGRKKVASCFTHEEVDLIIEQADRTSFIGKRDYAALCLAVNTGLRASDIINLKLQDLDWKNDQINIVQKKTGHCLTLPLEPAVGNALVEYILHGRHDSDSKYVFLRDATPFTKLHDPRSIGCIINKYMQKASLPFETGDGKTFHGLRRSMGTWMLDSDIPLYTISQVLGHKSINSAKAYLSVNELKLAECSLDFELIAVETGVYA